LNINREKNMTSFEKRCELLNYMMIGSFDYEPYNYLREQESLYLYSAAASHLKLVTPGPVMIAQINRVFEWWLFMVGKEDTGFNSIWEIDPDIPKFDIDEFTSQDLYDSIEGDPDIKIRWY